MHTESKNNDRNITHVRFMQPSLSGCLSHEFKMRNQTDQSTSPYPMMSAILIGLFDFLFYIHGTSNLKSTVNISHYHGTV